MELVVSTNRAARLKVKRYSKIEHANANWMKVGVAITSHKANLWPGKITRGQRGHYTMIKRLILH